MGFYSFVGVRFEEGLEEACGCGSWKVLEGIWRFFCLVLKLRCFRFRFIGLKERVYVILLDLFGRCYGCVYFVFFVYLCNFECLVCVRYCVGS